jgi:NADPH:quinone reductase-like Zn-dependent oxidoreductase
MQWRNGGTYAEYVTAPEEILAPKPSNVTFEQAATVPTAGYIALLNLRLSLLTPGKRVLVNGAAGGVGAIVVQLAKAHGAEVTGVDHPAKLDAVLSLGADHVIDYTAEDFTLGPRYGLIVDIPGNRTWAECRRALTEDGAYVLIGHDHYGRVGRRWLGSIPRFAGLAAAAAFNPQLRRGSAGKLGKGEAMLLLRDYLAAGQLTPVVAKAFPLEEAAEAIRYLAETNPPGRIVLTPSLSPSPR